ncbi:MAG: type II CRISPR RNA-guided endonuclease Cas9, partial [Rikenellaceae bacterium]
MSKILGLDLGTNSIGWALVDDSEKKIIGMGSRIIPMGDTKTEYEQGATISRNAQRRTLRSSRRMNKRFKLRRNKLLYVLNEIDCLPDQFIFKNGIPESNKIQELELQPISKGSLQLDSVGYYESRVTALTEPVTKKKFGKILYGFNSLRGYAGGDNEEDIASIDDNENKANKSETFVRRVEIKKVEKTDIKFKPKKKDNDSELNKYKVLFLLDNEEKEAITELQNLEAETEEELEIRIKRTKSETTITLHLPNKTSWRKEMENNEEKLKDKSLTISELILSELRNDRYKKVRNQVFLRHRYQEEFDKVWEEQAKHYQFLNNCPKEKLNKIANYLFPGVKETQEKLREEAIDKGLYHIIRNQIIYYQRPIKPQTDLIRKCSFEKDEPVIPISHPLFQEFRCWKQINNLNITTKEEVWNDKKRKKIYQYTETQLTKEQKINIYEKLTSQKSVGYNDIRNILNIKKDDKSTYINGISPKEKFVGLETIYSITKVLGYKPDDDKIIGIWNSLYNSTGSEYDINSDKIKALKEYVSEDQALELAKKIKFVKRYGNLSEKAIKRILPLMQCKEAIVDNDAILKFNSIKSGEYINDIEDYVKEYIYKNDEIDNGMMEYMALSFIYGRHTKSEVQIQIKNYHEIKYKERKLRNPIVEQLCNESMQIIKSIWKKYSLDMSDLKINVELARDLKNSAAERAKIDERQKANKTINETIKQRLLELKKYSPDNLETYKIWSKQSIEEYPKFKKAKDPTQEEKETLRLWEEQKCVSPYTNKPIPLSRLFDKNEYNIDHIIPKQRFFDDSSSNKVICERSINIEKNNRTAWEYITNQNSGYEILGIEEYLNHINKNYYSKKKKNLLAKKIPNDFINRQLKDTQYISVAVRDELALIVGSDNVNSTTGEITDFLRSRWGLKKLFMEQTEERFKRMELWDNQRKWIERYDNEDGKNIYKIRYWSKRYDHRHHAIDALVVALTDKSDIYKLNNLNKELQDWLVNNKEQIGLNTEDNEGILESCFNLFVKKREN